MDRRFLTVLGVSLVFALVVSSIFYQLTARANNSGTKRPEAELKQIVIAARPLGVGVTVKPADVKLARVSAEAFPKGAFSKVEEVIDRPVISNILNDEALLEGRLAARGSGLGLAPIIPVGMRAVSVRVNDVAGVAGFVLPGMRVDVLVTGRPPASESTITATCLQNILVLSAGQTMQADKGGQAIQAPTVTLLVSPEQAETLTLANQEGRIQLVLRNGGDHGIEKTAGRQIQELYGGAARVTKAKTEDVERVPHPRPVKIIAAAPPRPPAPAPPAPDQIIMIRGNARSIEVVGK
jgi:pilus assembly protein CpaB